MLKKSLFDYTSANTGSKSRSKIKVAQSPSCFSSLANSTLTRKTSTTPKWATLKPSSKIDSMINQMRKVVINQS